jgi:mRNA interferase MazF
MTVTRGDVVLVHFPFASGIGSKVRPALVVQSNQNNARMSNTIVVQITTNLRRAGEATQLLIDPATRGGRPSGLVSPSAVSCENIATISESRIARTIGRLPKDVMQHVDDCLRASLGL